MQKLIFSLSTGAHLRVLALAISACAIRLKDSTSSTLPVRGIQSLIFSWAERYGYHRDRLHCLVFGIPARKPVFDCGVFICRSTRPSDGHACRWIGDLGDWLGHRRFLSRVGRNPAPRFRRLWDVIAFVRAAMVIGIRFGAAAVGYLAPLKPAQGILIEPRVAPAAARLATLLA